MRTDILADVSEHPAGRIRLTGRVFGIEACELLADRDEIVVGSDIACDLVVPDPLIPPRAFRLRRAKCHSGTDRDCRCHWVLDALRNTRLYVNRHLTHHEKLSYGDVISVGCHDLEFHRVLDETRNQRLNRNVSDICRKLIADHPLPPGFLEGTATYQYFKRRRTALSIVGTAAGILLLAMWLTPREPYFEPVQEAIQLEIADPALSANAVRSLEAVERKNFDTQEPTLDKADLVEPQPKTDALQPAPILQAQDSTPVAPPTLAGPVLDSGTLKPVPVVADLPANIPIRNEPVKLASIAPATKQTVTEFDTTTEKPVLAKRTERSENINATVLLDTRQDPLKPPADIPPPAAGPSWKLPAMRPASVTPEGPVVAREIAKLAATAPTRRLSVEEAAQRATEKSDLAGFHVKMDQGLAQKVTAKALDQNLAATLAKPATENLAVDRAAYMEQLARYKASPVQFEEFKGLQVPVARITEQLTQLETRTDSTNSILLADGTVTAEEMAASWKSGRFKMHKQGSSPPDADPPTYCYVGKSEMDGKPCLYISFVCIDPATDQLKLASGNDSASNLIKDDSVEVFLDTNSDRKDYHQLIVNAKGNYWAGYWAAPMSDGGKATQWACTPTIKSTINKTAGQWTCEITIPFDKLGGAPAKGTRWAVNFCRNFRGQIEDWQLQSWFAVYDKNRNFHHPNLFGIFQW